MSRQVAITAIILSAVCHCNAYDMIPRWGAASLYTPSPPTLYISGGKTSTPDGTYSSSPNSPDLIRLSFSSNFSTSSPPYELLNTSSSPAYAWHTLSQTSSDPVGALSFGGDGGSSTPLPAGTDSSWLLSIPSSDPLSFNQQTSDWATQPQRRILHSSTTGDGLVYITGGQRNDGSGIILSDSYAYNPNTTIFTPLPSLPKGIAHHISTFLSNGTIVILGGISTTSITGNPTLNDLGTIYTLDTKSTSPAWWQASVGGMAPPPRRGASGILMTDEKLYLVGGTGMSSAEAMGDVWLLDMRSGVWSQVNTTGNSPSARFDHTAVNIGGGQILIVGGYGAGSPVSPETYILDTNTNTWVTSFVAPSSPSSSPAPTPSASSSDASQPTINANSASSSDGQATLSTGSTSSSASSTPSPSSTESPSPQPSTAQLSKSAQIGLALGVTMGLGVLAALIVLLIRRRRAGYGPAGEDDDGYPKSPSGWLSPRPPPVEKDGQALLGDPRSGARPGEWSEKGGIIGLGLGAMGVGISAFRTGNQEHGKYQQLDDDGIPTRQPTRRSGAGIKLIGPRSNPSSSSAKSPPRIDILQDEDSRTFLGVPKGRDWKVDRDKKEEWRSANTVLGHGDEEEEGPIDPFEDIPLIRGGPVPTPTGRRSLGPFDDGEEVDITTAVSRGPGLYQLPPLASSDPLDIAGLLAPPKGYNDTSLPHSSHSHSSFNTSGSEAEEDIIHHAQFASQSSALYSPQETEYVPIKRNESFFRRMANGGISTLIGGRKEGVRRSMSGDIRDPAPGPGPSLWPVESRDELDEGSSHPPSTWRKIGQNRMPSSGSLASGSMRDMHVVRREGTGSEASLQIIEQEESEMGTPVLDGLSPLVTSGSKMDNHRSIYASPTEEDIRSNQQYLLPIITTSSTPPIPPAQPPSGSPLPKHLVEHRRPVKDMVFSINKRATLGPESMSPSSQYSVTPGQTPVVGGMEDGRRGSWQVRRRESLVVANPDKRGLRGGV